MKLKDLYSQIADVTKGIALELRHMYNTKKAKRIGNEIVIYAVPNGNMPTAIVSDKPFGSKWLTKRSKVWRSRTTSAYYYLMRYAGNDGIALSRNMFDSLTLKQIKTMP